MATRTSVGSGNWGTAGTWDTGIPADGDDVVIASGHTVTFNVDQSAFTTGVGITITGTLTHTTTTGTYCLFAKTGASIVGAGTWNIGTSGTPIPFAAKHTITGAAGWYVDGNAGLTMTVYGAEPSIKYVKLSANEAIGQTELSVDTDVTGDIWAAGDSIYVNNELRVIASGGIAAGAITITAGLTYAKTTGHIIALATRNIQIVQVGTPSYTIYRVSNLTVASGWFIGNNKAMVSNCTMTFSGGVITNSYPALQTTTLSQSGGVIAACTTYAMRYVTFTSSTGGLIIGSNCALRETSNGNIGTLIISGCSYGAYFAYNITTFTNTIIDKCGIGFDSSSNIYLNNVTITNCGTGFNYCNRLWINGGTFTNNTYHIRSSIGTGYGVTFTGGTEVFRNNNADQSSMLETFEVFNYGGVAGAYKSWTRGGTVTSQATILPSGYSLGYLFALEQSLYCFRRIQFVIPAGESIKIDINLRKSASMTYLPRVELYAIGQVIDAGITPIDSFTMTDSIDTWENDTFAIDNSSGTTDLIYTLWVYGKNSTGNMYFAYDITTQGGSGGGGAVSIQPIQGTVGL